MVETTNYINGFQGSTADVVLTERYTRVAPDLIHWEVTVKDPKTWTAPYTFMIKLKKTDALIYDTPVTRATTRWRASWPAPVARRPGVRRRRRAEPGWAGAR